jgi:hypothetical protein
MTPSTMKPPLIGLGTEPRTLVGLLITEWVLRWNQRCGAEPLR